MKNKVLVELYIVEADKYYNVFIPVNEYIGKVVEFITNSAFELSDITPSKQEYYLINPDNGSVYENSKIVRETDIRNAKKIFLV